MQYTKHLSVPYAGNSVFYAFALSEFQEEPWKPFKTYSFILTSLLTWKQDEDWDLQRLKKTKQKVQFYLKATVKERKKANTS